MFKRPEFLRINTLGCLTLILGLSCVATSCTDHNRKDASYSNVAVPDQELARKIQDKVNSGWFSKGSEQVTVQVNNGVVTIQGFVKTQSNKDKIEAEIRNIEGVKSLNSQLVAREPEAKANASRQFTQDTYASPADDQLNKKIRDNTSRGWLWDSYEEVILNTANGEVILEGNIESVDDQQKFMKEIQKIEGVKTVKSNLKINNW